MKKPSTDVLYQEESSYKDMLLRKSWRMRIMETVAFVIGMMILAQILPSNDTAFKVLAFAIAIAVVGLAPFLYKSLLRPVYKLTKTHQIITMSGQEPRVGGKRESLMVSRQFLSHLNERLFYYNKANKKRR